MSVNVETLPLRISLDHGKLHASFEGSLKDCIQVLNEFFARYSRQVGSTALLQPRLQGLVEYSADGMPKFTANLDHLKKKELIALTLYAKDPVALSSGEISEIFSRNFQRANSRIIAAYLASDLKPYAMSEKGSDAKLRYRLTERAKRWVEEEILGKVNA